MKKIYLALLFIGILALCTPRTIQAQFNQETRSQDIPGIRVFPNPVSGNTINIESKSKKSLTVKIFNVLGENIKFKVMTTQELDISDLNPGVYIMRIRQGEHSTTVKVVKT